MISVSYFLMLGFLLAHELDAMKRHEWRILPIVSRMGDKYAEQFFILAHIPLFATLFYFDVGDPGSTMAKIVSVFSIVHIVLHWIFRTHPNNEFNNRASWALIIGAGMFGAIHLTAG